jgi:membrane protein
VRAGWRDLAEAVARHPAGAFAGALYRRYRDTNVAMLAAALAYYAAFSLGPLLLLLGGWLGVVLRDRPELAEPYREALETLVIQVFPLTDDAAVLVQQSVDTIVQQLGEGALLRSLISLLVLLWAASNFFASLQLAFERIFAVQTQRGFLRNRLVALLLVLAVAAFVAVEVVGATIGDAAGQLWSGASERFALFGVFLPQWHLPAAFSPVRLAVGIGVLTLAFRWLPRQHSDWSSALIAGVFGAVALAALRQALVIGFSAERINLIYGVVTGVVVLLLWLYLAMLVVLVAATLAAELARRRATMRS